MSPPLVSLAVHGRSTFIIRVQIGRNCWPVSLKNLDDDTSSLAGAQFRREPFRGLLSNCFKTDGSFPTGFLSVSYTEVPKC